MMRGLIGIAAGCAALCALAPLRTSADDSSPYSAIMERNVFDLKPPPPPVIDDPAKDKPKVTIKLTGITTILGPAKALFMVKIPDVPGKPPNKEESYILNEGERQGVLEVVSINVDAGTVKVKNDGVESELSLKDDKLPTGGAPGGIAPPPLPTFTPGQPFPGGQPGQLGRFGGRRAGAMAPKMPGDNADPSAYNAATAALMQRSIRSANGTELVPPASQPWTLQQSILANELQRIKNEQLNSQGIDAPPLPSILPREEQSQQGEGTSQPTPDLPGMGGN
jgi:hypothetical protein